MSRLAVSLVGILSLAGCAEMPTRSLHVDGADQAAFEASVASFKQELPTYRWQLFAIALRDLWQTTADKVGPNGSETDTSKAYLELLNGLTYREIVGLADATPPTTRQQYWGVRGPGSVESATPPMFSNPGPYNGTSYNRVFNVYPNGTVPIE
jgi:hypothetical protein